MSDLTVTASPHIRSKITTSGIMLMVIIALMPATGFAIFNFGLDVLYLVLVTVGTAVVTEFVCGLILKRAVTIDDYSAVVTGLILALSLPPGVPLWLGAVGGFFAILVVKMLFGGLGQNFMNPAMAAHCFLFISFASTMTKYQYDTEIMEKRTMLEMLLNNTDGAVGETSILALLFGAVILIVFGVIDLKIPGMYIISFMVFIVVFTGNLDATYLVTHLTGGGLLLAAFFMATDYSTRPISAGAQIFYGLLLGFLTAVFRFYGAGFEGVAFAIIIANLVVPLLDRKYRGLNPARK